MLRRIAFLICGLLVLLCSVVTPTVAAGVVSPSGKPLPACGTYTDTPTPINGYDDWQKTLLDTNYRVPKTYVPPGLVSISRAGISGEGQIRSIIVDDLRAMTQAAASAKAPIAVVSAFRSYSKQVSTFNGWVRSEGYRQALRVSARPGHSEHQLGVTLDFKSKGGKAPWNYADWATTAAGRWMANNAWRYGFVLSYPKGEGDKTCYDYEAWHYRYFGRDRAADMHASGLTTREYLWAHGSGEGGGGKDQAPPDVTSPVATIVDAPLTATKAIIKIAWSASDDSGVAKTDLEQKIDSGSWTTVSLSTPTQTSINLTLAFDHSYRYRVRATDAAGNTSDWSIGDPFDLTMTDDAQAGVSFAGTWTQESSTSYLEGSAQYSTTAADSVSFSFTGAGFAWIGKSANDRGKADLYVDGDLVASIDTVSSNAKSRAVLYEQSFDSVGTHAIQIVVEGTAGRPRVDVDGFLVID